MGSEEQGSSGRTNEPFTPPTGIGEGGGSDRQDRRDQTETLVNDLIATGRAATEDEINLMRIHVSQASFEPRTLSRVGRRGANVSWEGQVLSGSERFTSDIVHFVRHVLAGQEWPTGTTRRQYLDCLRDVVRENASGILLNRYFGLPILSFIGRSGTSRGPQGDAWIIVEYRVQLGYWVTGFQPIGGLPTILRDPNRDVLRWLRPPI